MITYVFISKPEDYKDANSIMMAYLATKKDMTGVYVTLNSPYREITRQMEANRINTNKILFIDGTDEAGCNEINCISLEGNKSLTALSLAMTQSCKNPTVQYLFFDSITTLLLYNDIETTQRFMHFLINKIQNLDIFMILICVEEEKSSKLMPFLSQILDGIVRL